MIPLSSAGTSSGASVGRRGSISCYKCNSRNRTNPACHDPIHPDNPTRAVPYIEQCKVPKEGHIGLFPATYCIKVIGVSKVTREEVVIRACSLENMDNQCGDFKYEGESFEGCILTCHYDGCNRGDMKVSVPLFIFLVLILSCVVSYIH